MNFIPLFRFLAFSSIPYSENRHKRLSMADAFAPFASPVITAGRAGVTGVVSALKYVLSECRTCEIEIENRTGVALSDVGWCKHCGRSSGTPPSANDSTPRDKKHEVFQKFWPSRMFRITVVPVHYHGNKIRDCVPDFDGATA